MNWAELAKKNKDKEQVKPKKEEKVEQKKVYNKYSHLPFKDVEDEFEYKYLNKLTDISIEFRDYVNKNYLPFMDKIMYVKYNIYDFIKNNSEEFTKTLNHVEEYNKDLIKEYDKELEEIEKELMEEEYISD